MRKQQGSPGAHRPGPGLELRLGGAGGQDMDSPQSGHTALHFGLHLPNTPSALLW